MQEIISIQNLKCSGCKSSIINTLMAFTEVSGVEVKMADAQVEVETSLPDQREKYEEALTKAGYPPVGEANTLGTKTKSYVSCAIGRISNALED